MLTVADARRIAQWINRTDVETYLTLYKQGLEVLIYSG